MKRLRIGVIARHFPPAIGGMEALAYNLSVALAQTDDLTVFTRRGFGVKTAAFEQKPLLSKDIQGDVRHLKRQDVDVWLALNAGSSAIADQLSAPVCAYFHGNDFLVPSPVRFLRAERWLNDAPYIWRYQKVIMQGLRRRVLRTGMNLVSRIFTNSKNTARLIRRTYPRTKPPIIVIPPGVDDSFFAEAIQPGQGVSNDNALRFLTVSRLPGAASRKNIHGVLSALSLLPSNINWTYTVVGDGPDRPRLENFARDIRVSDRVTFLGRVSDRDLRKYYRDSDLFILAPRATRCDVEGFGIVYIEASASGTPVLGSCEGGATDAIQDGVNGILIAKSSPKAIADGIVRFAQDRNRFSPERVRSFAEQFRWNVVARRLRKELSEVCECPGLTR